MNVKVGSVEMSVRVVKLGVDGLKESGPSAFQNKLIHRYIWASGNERNV